MKNSRKIAGLEVWDRASSDEFPALKIHITENCLFSSVIQQG